MGTMKTLLFLGLVTLVVANGGPANNGPSCMDSVNRYSEYETFGSVIVRCPLNKVWPKIGNVEKWFQSVVGQFLIDIATNGAHSEIQSNYNYNVSPTSPGSTGGNTQQRVVSIDGFNFELITTFDFSTLPLGPNCSPPCTGWQEPANHEGHWTTRVRAHKILFDNPECFTTEPGFSTCTAADGVDWTLIDFGQWGDFNVPDQVVPLVRAQIQSFFYSVFAPELKKAFDNCEEDADCDECEPSEVVSFRLINARTGEVVRELMDGDTIECPSKISIEAVVTGNNAESVFWEINEEAFFTDNASPYYIRGDDGNTIKRWKPDEGTYIITATPYHEDQARGKSGIQKTFSVTVNGDC